MIKNVVVAGTLLLAATFSLMAQSAQGVVTGTITDSSGASVPSAEVTLRNMGTQVQQKTNSDSHGDYRFPLVPAGTYTVIFKASGFTDREIKDIVVDVSTTVPVSAVMSIKSASQSVDVTEAPVLVQTSSSDLLSTVNTRTIENMPLLTRNVFDLAFTAPAVTQGMNFNATSGGSRESGTTFILNGADNNNNFSEGGTNVTPPLESVSEFTMLTNNMSAEYGHAAGALVSAIQKAGTNSFHGAAYEFNRNRALNAEDFFSNRGGLVKPQYIRNQYGGEVDGPIFKNKTFFMGAYDRYSIIQGSPAGGAQGVVVPTPTELTAMETNAGPIANQVISTYKPLTSNTPCPNAPASAAGHLGCIFEYDPNTTGQNIYTGRVDHNFSEKDRLSFTANITRYSNVDKYGGGYATGATSIPENDKEHYHQLVLNETHAFGASLVNEFTLAHNRHLSDSFEGNGTSVGPRIVIDDTNYGGLGFGYGAGEGGLTNSFAQDRWQVQDNLSWTRGKHSFKFGGGMQYGILYRNWDLGTPGYYEFANTTGSAPGAAYTGAGGTIYATAGTGSALKLASNFENDFPYYQEASVNPQTGGAANAYRHYIMKDLNFFVNDSWKATSRLTFNLGLRWERYGAPTEANGIISQFVNLDTKSIADIANARVGPVSSMWKTPNGDYGPRFGFAYDLLGDGKTSLRGGYGISYDRLFDNIWSNGAWNPPFYGLVDHDASAGDHVYYAFPASIGATFTTLPRVSVRTMDVNMRDSSTENYYLGVEHQFWNDFLLRVNYQGNFGRHLSQLMNLNRYDGMEYQTVNLSSSNPGRPNALYTGFNYRANNVNSEYNSLVTEVQKRFSHGLQMQFSFTWSKLMDEGSDLFSASTTSGGYSQPFYFISNNAPQLERAPGAFDHTKNFKTLFTYELPFLKNQKGILGRIAGGWQVSSFYQGYSGHPIEVYNGRALYVGNALDANGRDENIGGDYNYDGVANDHPNFIGSSVNAAYSGNSPANGIFTSNGLIGCGYVGAQSTNIAACNKANGVTTPNSLFVNPSGLGPRFGELGRNVFRGPWFNGWDATMSKNFRLADRVKLQIRFDALNVDNHPNFDGITTNLNSSNFGKAQILIGNATSRLMQLGGRITF